MTKAICVWYWFIFLPYVCPFLKFLCWTINWWLCKQNITWLRQSVHKRKAETVQSDTVGYYHRSKLCCLGIHEAFIELSRFIKKKLTHVYFTFTLPIGWLMYGVLSLSFLLWSLCLIAAKWEHLTTSWTSDAMSGLP